MSRRTYRRSRTRGTIFWGLLLIVVGIWLLLEALGLSRPGIVALWPIFPTAVGLGLFGTWLFSADKRTEYGIAIPATINLLIGLFFFLFTFGIFPWSAMAYLWPVFPLIVGIAFIVAWVLSLFRAWGLLIPGSITAAVGLVGLAFTLAETGNVYLDLFLQYWPVLLIFVGLVVLVATLVGRAGGQGGREEPSADLEDFGEKQGTDQETTTQEYKRKEEQGPDA
jgi:hypothetical protein